MIPAALPRWIRPDSSKTQPAGLQSESARGDEKKNPFPHRKPTLGHPVLCQSLVTDYPAIRHRL
jgi:hypothetical protein